MKGLTCADGQKQWKKEVTGDATYLTVFMESIPTTVIIDEHEGRDVGTCDNLGVFLSAYMSKDPKMVLRGRLEEMMEKQCPKYKDRTWYTSGE